MSAVAIETVAPRGVGRPSKAAQFRALAREVLKANPGAPIREIFELAKASGYTGERSAIYAMVAGVRSEVVVASALASFARTAAWRKEEKKKLRIDRAERRARRRAERERMDATDQERVALRARERMGATLRREAAREDRTVDWDALQHHPTAADEESPLLRVYARKWFASCEATHKSTRYQRARWLLHLEPFFGNLEPHEVDTARIRAFVEDRLAYGLSASSVGMLVQSTFSGLLTELVDQGVIDRNAVHSVPKAVRRLYKSKHDPRSTPFIERMEDIARLRNSLKEPLRTFFSVGVMSGIRPGEIIALEWGDLRSDLRLMHVQRRYLNGKIDTPKSGKPRLIPVAPALADVLREWRRTSGATGLVFKPSGRSSHLTLLSMSSLWIDGLKRAGLPHFTFYQATRHTFASQWVMAGHSIEKLSKILGHCSITITEIYAHLKPESLVAPDVISFGAQTSDVSRFAEGSAA